MAIRQRYRTFENVHKTIFARTPRRGEASGQESGEPIQYPLRKFGMTHINQRALRALASRGVCGFMFTASISQKVSIRLRFIFQSSLCLLVLILSACASTPASSTYTATSTYPTSSTDNTTTGNTEDSSYIVVGPRPEIIVKSENAAQLTFVGSDTQKNISTDRFSLPYKKEGNKVTIDFGEAVVQSLEIKVPREANLNIILANGNVVVSSIQGQLAMTLASGTIQIKNFAPMGKNTIQSKNGTIDVTFADKSSCSLKAQTNFGAIVSRYSAINEKRSGMQDQASGTIGSGSGATVNLVGGYGSITIGPV
jgi:hypothetical protein